MSNYSKIYTILGELCKNKSFMSFSSIPICNLYRDWFPICTVFQCDRVPYQWDSNSCKVWRYQRNLNGTFCRSNIVRGVKRWLQGTPRTGHKRLTLASEDVVGPTIVVAHEHPQKALLSPPVQCLSLIPSHTCKNSSYRFAPFVQQ